MPVCPRRSWPTGSVFSAPACYRRVRALRESGLIEREVALVAPSTMGWPITMLVLVTLERDHGPHRR